MKPRLTTFRVWDDDSHYMVYNPTLLVVHGDISLIKIQHSCIEHIQSNIIAMAGVGFKDKYNKEIYEGDIVRKNTMLFTVTWNGEEARYELIDALPKQEACEFSVWSAKELEVIGNTFELPIDYSLRQNQN